MKKLLLILSLAVATTGMAQIEIKKETKFTTVGENKINGSVHSQLEYNIDDTGDTMYVLSYKNAKYESISDYKAIAFRPKGNTLNSLYDILKNFFTDENKKNKDYQVSFKLGLMDITTKTASNSVMFYTSDGHFFLTEKQVDKLFGK